MEIDQTTHKTPKGPWLGPTEALGYCDPSDVPGQNAVRTEENSVRYGFRVGSLGLLIAQQTASELVGDLSVYPVPNTPYWFPGLVNLRGNLIPVFDLKLLFALPGDGGTERKLVVLDKEESAAGVYVDGFPRPLRLGEPMARTPSLPGVLEDHVAQAYFLDDVAWLELRHRDFFAAVGKLMAVRAATE